MIYNLEASWIGDMISSPGLFLLPSICSVVLTDVFPLEFRSVLETPSSIFPKMLFSPMEVFTRAWYHCITKTDFPPSVPVRMSFTDHKIKK